MSAKPPIAMRRPSRTAVADPGQPTRIEPTAIPTIDPDSTDALAFSMQGRANPISDGRSSGSDGHAKADGLGGRSASVRNGGAETAVGQGLASAPSDEAHAYPPDVDGAGPGLVSIKLPPEIGRQLAAIADRRGSKRTLIAIEALGEPLRALAAAHRAGGFPDLPKIVSGTVRSSIAFSLPPDLGADLDYVLKIRRAVRAQVVTRLLAPAVRALYDAEVGQRNR